MQGVGEQGGGRSNHLTQRDSMRCEDAAPYRTSSRPAANDK